MSAPAFSPGLRRAGLGALVLVALTMAGAVAYVMLTDDRRAREAVELLDEAPPFRPEQAPKLYFKESLRSYDPSLNRFIDRLIRTTREGRYDEFRQMWTRRLDPISLDKYQQLWKLVREVEVTDLVRESAKPGNEVYLIRAQIKVENPDPAKFSKPVAPNRALLIVREGDDWALSPRIRENTDTARP